MDTSEYARLGVYSTDSAPGIIVAHGEGRGKRGGRRGLSRGGDREGEGRGEERGRRKRREKGREEIGNGGRGGTKGID